MGYLNSKTVKAVIRKRVELESLKFSDTKSESENVLMKQVWVILNRGQFLISPTSSSKLL